MAGNGKPSGLFFLVKPLLTDPIVNIPTFDHGSLSFGTVTFIEIRDTINQFKNNKEHKESYYFSIEQADKLLH